MTMTAKEFKKARETFNISQTAMGEKLGGYKLRTVQSWEAGERAIPQGVVATLSLLNERNALLDVVVRMVEDHETGNDKDLEKAAIDADHLVVKITAKSWIELA